MRHRAGPTLAAMVLVITGAVASRPLCAEGRPASLAPSSADVGAAAGATNKEKSMENAKRRVPKVEPVQIGAIRYEVLKAARGRGFGQNGGIIAAIDVASGKELWALQIYTTTYDAHEEADAQDRFITKMAASEDRKSLLIESENKKTYIVRLADRSIALRP